jgi:hypothetical protein
MTMADTHPNLLGLVQWLHQNGRVYPDDYPLPRTNRGVAYWAINFALCACATGWAEWQSKRDMAQIIPVIRWLAGGS